MTGSPSTGPESGRSARVLLALAAVAVAFAAADTYVVVLALPDMMAAAGISADQLQRAAPVVSGFLLGYVAVLPTVGRVADLRGRRPVLVGSLVVFAVGSLVTAAAYSLPSMVVGRFLQGLGGGGLVPATLALVADIYPAHRRGVPLGIIGAVQELGSVLGPLYGAALLAVGSWRTIFLVNLGVGLVLASVLRSPRVLRSGRTDPAGARADVPAAVLGGLALACVLLVMTEPDAVVADVTWGVVLLPVSGGSRWLTPVALAGYGLLALALLRLRTRAHRLTDAGAWREVGRRVDLPAAGLLTVALSGVVVAFATADPAVQVLSPAGPWALGISAAAAAGFVLRNRHARAPLVPRHALGAAPAWGALVVSFFVGAALIAALVDIPVTARLTVYADSQLSAALVLVRLLVALPVGALAGGWLSHRLPAGPVTAAGMALGCAGFAMMSRWDLDTLAHASATVPLVLAGLGFGTALAPVNAALLAGTRSAVHGVASALLVVARMVGMLVGVSALTTLGLHRYYAEQRDLPAPMEVCGSGVSRCPEFTRMLQEAGLTQVQTIFAGAAVCCLVAGLLALLLFRSADTRRVPVQPFAEPLG